ncbi:MAG: hypothetical protein ACKPES_01890 [Dolichospermum sp.]
MNKSYSLDQLLHRLSSQPNGNIWIALITQSDQLESTIEDFQDTLDIFNECETGLISAQGGVFSLVKQIEENPESYLLLYNFEGWDQQDWKTFDGFRSRLDRGKKGGCLILTEQSSRLMLHNAPNFVSWLGARIYPFLKDAEMLTSEERDRRLTALQNHFNQSNEEIIQLAKNRQLPSDPEFAEWLILLDRGDLLELQK